MTPEQHEFLRANELPRQRWLYSENARPIIDELCDAGLMQAASGEFGPMVDKGERIDLLGREVPVFNMASLYMLTRYGKTLYEAAPQGAS